MNSGPPACKSNILLSSQPHKRLNTVFSRIYEAIVIESNGTHKPLGGSQLSTFAGKI